MKLYKSISAFFLLGSASIFSLTAQEQLKSMEEEYFDFLSLQGICERPVLAYRTLSDSNWIFLNDEAMHPWKDNNLGKKYVLFEDKNKKQNFFLNGINQNVKLKIYGPSWFNSYNTHCPYGQNDGALWQGKGYNASLSFGARLESYGFEATFKPQLGFSQNAGFDLIPQETSFYKDEYGYFWKGDIDLPQRFGQEKIFTYDWGDTELRYTWRTLTFGFGTQAIWLGSAQLNPMLSSNNAPSFPKFDAGLRKQKIIVPKLGWDLGSIEGRIYLGRLAESAYFDSDSSNDKRQLTVFVAVYSFPEKFLKGLSIGAAKICQNYWNEFSLKYLNPFYSNNNWSDGGGEDQKMSFFVDWIFPNVGFEIYAEIGKDDYSAQKWAAPFHTAIYTVGLKKAVPFTDKISGKLMLEWSNSEMSQDFQNEWKYMGFYAHSGIKQGYTNGGQIIGAGTGYFGNSQYIGFNLYYPKGSALLYMHRHSPDTNYNYSKSIGNADTSGSESYKKYWQAFKTFKTFGLSTDFFITKDFAASAGIEYSSIYFKNYSRSEENWGWNLHLTAGLKYNF